MRDASSTAAARITPDVVVPDDTLTTAEQTLAKALAPKAQETYVVLYKFSLDLKNKVTPTFASQPQWRDEFYNRLQAAGVNDRSQGVRRGTAVRGSPHRQPPRATRLR